MDNRDFSGDEVFPLSFSALAKPRHYFKRSSLAAYFSVISSSSLSTRLPELLEQSGCMISGSSPTSTCCLASLCFFMAYSSMGVIIVGKS